MKRSPLPPRKAPLRRSTKPIARHAPLPRPTKPIARTVKPKARRVPKRFAHLRDPRYKAWISSLPCLITGKRTGQYVTVNGWLTEVVVDPAHVKTRNSGGPDRGNLVPLARHLHEEQHRGIKSFQKKYGLDLRAIAQGLEARYTHHKEQAA